MLRENDLKINLYVSNPIDYHGKPLSFYNHKNGSCKSLLELWFTTFLSDWQPLLIFVQFVSNFLCMCFDSMASAHVVFNI